MKQRKKNQKTTKNTLPKLKVISKASNKVGVICTMDYGNEFPTMKGFEIDFKSFEDAVEEQRMSPATQEQIDEATATMVEYHIYSLGLDDKFCQAVMVYVVTRKLAEDALKHQQNRSIGFLMKLDYKTGDIMIRYEDYDEWEKHKAAMEVACNKKFTYN